MCNILIKTWLLGSMFGVKTWDGLFHSVVMAQQTYITNSGVNAIIMPSCHARRPKALRRSYVVVASHERSRYSINNQ